MSTQSTITVLDLKEIEQEKNVTIIDVRTPSEYREVHATGARNVPLESLDPEVLKQQRMREGNGPLYVICQSGNRSSKACEKLAAAGHTDIVNVEGGTNS